MRIIESRVAMDRRNFVKLLTTGMVALSVPPIQWLAGKDQQIVAPRLLPDPPTEIGDITESILRELAGYMPGYRATFIEGRHMIGTGGFTDLFGVDIAMHGVPFYQEYRAPCAAKLAWYIKEHRPRILGALPEPSDILAGGSKSVLVTDETTGLVLRGIEYYDVRDDRIRHRFDLLCGELGKGHV